MPAVPPLTHTPVRKYDAPLSQCTHIRPICACTPRPSPCPSLTPPAPHTAPTPLTQFHPSHTFPCPLTLSHSPLTLFQPAWWKWYYWLDPLSYALYGIIGSQLGDVDYDYVDAGDGGPQKTVGRRATAAATAAAADFATAADALAAAPAPAGAAAAAAVSVDECSNALLCCACRWCWWLPHKFVGVLAALWRPCDWKRTSNLYAQFHMFLPCLCAITPHR